MTRVLYNNRVSLVKKKMRWINSGRSGGGDLYVHIALLDVLEALVDILGEFLPDAYAELPLELVGRSHLAGQDLPQSLDLILDLQTERLNAV